MDLIVTSRTRAPARTRLSVSLGALLAAVLIAPGLPAPLAAQDAATVEWRNTTEFSYLLSGGNSGASTLGLRHGLRRTDDRGAFRLDLNALRTDAVRISRVAVGTSQDNFEVEEDRERERTAERFGVETRYDLNLSERFFAFAGAGWNRNTFAGFESRTVIVTGAGNQWGQGSDWELKVGYGLTYTVQDDVTPDPDRASSFAGLRATLDYTHELTESTGAEVKWVLDGNARETSDVRGDLTHTLTSTLSERLALKTTLQLLVDAEPPLQSLPLTLPNGEPAGTSVLTPLRRLDHSLSVALVVTF
jgi:putative salt-induced outer membrane protein YdiY